VPKTHKVNVPQKEGQIVIRNGIDEPVTYKVIDGAVTVADADLSTFLAAVDDSRVVGDTTAQKG